MICSEINCCRIAFSPEAAIWIRRVQVYYSIFCYHKGKIKNRGNLKRAARRCNIADPLRIPIKKLSSNLRLARRIAYFIANTGNNSGGNI